MSGLAKYLLEDGFEVLGSDIKRNRNIDELEKLGAKIFIGHDENNLPEDCIIVVSSVIKEKNPELIKAKELGLEILHRSDLLARISEGLASSSKKKYFIGYCGTHGKTTTSGLASYVLQKAELKPSFVVGGIVPEYGINSNAGDGEHFIAELDESDGTIVKYNPEVTVINNLDVDHTDFYKDGLTSLVSTFKTYLNLLTPDSKVLINFDNDGTKRLLKESEFNKFIKFGINDSDDIDYVAKNIRLGKDTTFDIYHKGKLLISMKTQMPGVHNVYNAMAVMASLNETGVDVEKVKQHFYTFTGMGRRLQVSAEWDNIRVYDDYAHHPTEIKATLSALKTMDYKNVIAVFQPHRYSRFSSLRNDFLNAFSDADKVIVTDVYAASEEKIESANPEVFAQELLSNVPCEYIAGSIDKVAKELFPTLKSGDVVVGLGAGTITTLGKDLLTAKDEAVNVRWVKGKLSC